ncbi:MAG: hypothetical protein U5J98_12670 [Halobacteriales archaeon]|nr:hypothetical protein [Halobacteriales archaeon]
MSNDEPGAEEEAVEADDFYVPATFQFSRGSGRVERVLVGLFENEGDLEVRRVADEETPDFYSPAMFKASAEPGRIERFLKSVFERTDDQGRQVVPKEYRDDFYLPGVDPDEYKQSK